MKRTYGITEPPDFFNSDNQSAFVFYWHFVGWWAISFGFHVDVKSPNIEVHLPFGFLRMGWVT